MLVRKPHLMLKKEHQYSVYDFACLLLYLLFSVTTYKMEYITSTESYLNV